VSPDFGQAARHLLGDGTPDQLAERASQACERLAKHLSRLLGETGVELLLKRSIVLAGAQFPWLIVESTDGDAASRLRDALARQEPASIGDAVVAVLSTFVGLLERLIGAGLVDRLLAEVWPAVFVHVAKDAP
jgi:hypothetical protein